MQVDWRSLLDSLRVPWIDRGKNASAENINIKCCWCHDDPSYHLGISMAKEAFYCYRDPNRHSGRNFVSLLIRLGQTRDEAIRLLNYYRVSYRGPPISEQKKAAPEVLLSAWQRFAPAHVSEKCLSYLSERGFRSPRAICEQYDLRCALEGKWANRLLIPLHRDREVITWTGRDITNSSHLKYRAQPVEGFQPLYAPDWNKPNTRRLLIVEGPLDALRISSASRREPWLTIALCGKQLSAGKLMAIRQMAGHCESALICMDADVSMSACYHIIGELAGAIKARHIGRAKLPTGVKDPGEINEEGIIPWLNASLSQIQSNAAA